jgi:GTP-binding protein
LNKIDIPEAKENLPRLRTYLQKQKHECYEISAASGEGVPALLNRIGEILREVAARPPVVAEPEIRTYSLADLDEKAFVVQRIGPTSFAVTGKLIERTTKMTNFDLIESSDRFQKILETSGITKELNRLGIEHGDTVIIADRELIWGIQEELEPVGSRRRTARERYLNRKSRAAE